MRKAKKTKRNPPAAATRRAMRDLPKMPPISEEMARDSARPGVNGAGRSTLPSMHGEDIANGANWGRRVAALLYRYYPAKRGTTTIHDFDGDLTMTLDRASQISAAIYWSGHHSLPLIRFLRNFLTPEMTLVDVGANIGEVTLFAAKKLQGGGCWHLSRCQWCLRSLRGTWS